MKNILTIFLLTLTVSCFGQTYGWMLRIDPGQDADTANMGVVWPDGNANLTGRVHYVSYETVLNRLIAFSPDTVYVNAGDSLVIVSIHGDTTYFAGGGAGITDGDKGDITVSLGGTTWTVDSGLAATKIADGTVSNTEFQYIGGVTSDVQTQLNNKASSGVNTDINSVVLDNTGLKIKDGTKNLTLSSASGLSADRTLTFDVNNMNITLDLESNINVVGVGGVSLSGGSTLDGNSSGVNTGDQDLSGYATTAALALKVNISDTSTMLTHYIERGDTATMNAHFVERADTANMLLHFVERGDTSNMLSHYIERGDTASMLLNYPVNGEVVHLTGDESINGEKTFNDSLRVDDYALFKGLYGGLATKIEILKDGVLQFDNEAGEDGKYNLKIKPLQSGYNNSNWNISQGTFANAWGARNTDVVEIGINGAPGSGRENTSDAQFVLSWEHGFMKDASHRVDEFHYKFTDTLGVQYRPFTMEIDYADTTQSAGAFEMPKFQWRPQSTINKNEYAEVRYDQAAQRSYFTLDDPETVTGLQIFADGDDQNIQFSPHDMPSAIAYFNFWGSVYPNRLNFQTDEGTPTGLVGRNGSGWMAQVTNGWGNDIVSGALVIDSSQVATQYDLTTISSGSTDLSIGGSGPTYTIESSTGTDVTIQAGGINALSESPANTLVITATELDGSTTNEIQDITVTGASQPFTLDLGSDATDATITGAGTTTITRSGNDITITSSGVTFQQALAISTLRL